MVHQCGVWGCGNGMEYVVDGAPPSVQCVSVVMVWSMLRSTACGGVGTEYAVDGMPPSE